MVLKISMTRMLMLSLLVFTATNASEQDMKEASEKAAEFDITLVEQLALFYAEESIKQMSIPLALRIFSTGDNKPSKKAELKKLRNNPPKINADGVVYPLGENNPLSFIYSSQNRTMTVSERIINKRGVVGYYGLTAIELAGELNKESSRKKDRAEADFAYDSIADNLSLQRLYNSPPENKKKFYQAVDRIIKAKLKWTQKERFLNAARAAAARNQLPESASTEIDGFKAHLILRHFSVTPDENQFYTDRYVKGWDRKPSLNSPLLVSDQKVSTNQILNGFIHFQGAVNGADGMANVVADFSLMDPNGQIIFEIPVVQIWRHQAPPQYHLQIGTNNISFSMDDESKIGQYTVEAKVCDQVSNRCSVLRHPIELMRQQNN